MKPFVHAWVLVVISSLSSTGNAEIFIAPERMDHPTIVRSDIVFDQSTHLYRYSYQITNPPDNPRGVEQFWVQLSPGVKVVGPVESPVNWRGEFIDQRSSVSWWASDRDLFIPPDYVDDGHSIPPFGPFIEPGESLEGFSFTSFGSPVAGVGYTQTFRPLPWADDAEELEHLPHASDQPEENGFQVAIQVPGVDDAYLGNRRPAVDGFLVFVNARNRDAFRESALIVLRFGISGEQVAIDTFKATLNRVDVTQMFAFSPLYDGWAATFTPDNSPLVEGSNVLLTSVSGTIPGEIDRPTLDTDRLTFTFSR